MTEEVSAPLALPVARVVPLLQVSHLDRDFDYLVPPELDQQAQPGVRVRIRFSGRLVDGYVLQRLARSDHDGKLARLDRVVSALPVLTEATLRLISEVAVRYAGTRADVLRLAIPPRHARVENAMISAAASGDSPPRAETIPGGATPDLATPDGATPDAARTAEPLAEYTHGAQFAAAAAQSRAPRGVWQALPGENWAARLTELAAGVIAEGRSVLLVVPDQADLDTLAAACQQLDPTVLSAGLGPSARYRRWLTALLGRSGLVIGTRSAAFVPLDNLGLVALWDDGDESLVEPRAPYPHAREVLALRAHQQGAALLLGGYARTPEAQALLDAGWAAEISAPRQTVRARSPRIVGVADSEFELARDPLARSARLPAAAFAAARAALDADRPVLVQVPRRGYAPAVTCARCRTPARCRTCHGPLEQLAGAADAMVCRWCATPDRHYRCPACGGTAMRAVIVGAARTADELGRAYPGAAVSMSGGERVLTHAPGGRRLVIATPGAEPTVDGGYGAALLLDGWLLLGRADLRAGEETLRRWMNAAALVASDGTVVCCTDATVPAVQALIRWDAAGFAATELAERAAVGFPPAVHLAVLDGATADVSAVVDAAELPDGAEVLGPVDLPPGVHIPGAPDLGAPPQRIVVRVHRRDGRALAQALSRAQVGRILRRQGTPVRIQIDPLRVG